MIIEPKYVKIKNSISALYKITGTKWELTFSPLQITLAFHARHIIWYDLFLYNGRIL